MMVADPVRCPHCNVEIPVGNQTLHELRCLGRRAGCASVPINTDQTLAASPLPATEAEGGEDVDRRLFAPTRGEEAEVTTRTHGSSMPVLPPTPLAEAVRCEDEVEIRSARASEVSTALESRASADTPQSPADVEHASPVEELPSSSMVDNEWTCTTCTFQNSTDMRRCEMCFNPRVTSQSSRHLTLQPLRVDASLVSDARFTRGRLACGALVGALGGVMVIFCSFVSFEPWLPGFVGTLCLLFIAALIGSMLGLHYVTRPRNTPSNARPLLSPEDLSEQGLSSLQLAAAEPPPLSSVANSRARMEQLDSMLARRLRRIQRRRHFSTANGAAQQRGEGENERVSELEARLDALLHLVEQHRQRQQQGGDDATPPAPPGLIAALPTHTLTAAQVEQMPAEHRACTICIEEFEEGDEVRMLPCFHRFHKGCVDRWLRRTGNCPICKHRVDGRADGRD